MARVNVSIPDDVIERAREAGLNVSRLATSALEEALERQITVTMLDDYLAALDEDRGPIPGVPAIVLAECLTGDHRRDHAVNRLLSMCLVRPVDEPLARRASALRGRSGRAGEISATDAVVVALAERVESAVVVTSDPRDITDLVDQSAQHIRVLAV